MEGLEEMRDGLWSKGKELAEALENSGEIYDEEADS